MILTVGCRYPVYFHWHGDGTVGRVYLAMNEQTISSNLKKGIISMLQLQTVDGERTEVCVCVCVSLIVFPKSQ